MCYNEFGLLDNCLKKESKCWRKHLYISYKGAFSFVLFQCEIEA